MASLERLSVVASSVFGLGGGLELRRACLGGGIGRLGLKRLWTVGFRVMGFRFRV